MHTFSTDPRFEQVFTPCATRWRRAIEKLEGVLLDGHLHSCVADGVREGREEKVIGELMELYQVSNR